MAKHRKRLHQMTIAEFDAMFATEDDCADYLVAHRWPDGTIYCPRCGAEVTHPVATMPYKWQCYSCAPGSGYRFSHLTGTIFENTNKPLRQWFRVIHMMVTSKKGVSAHEVYRVMGFGSYETALNMLHKIRAGMADEKFQKFIGIVEVDEAWIGGKAKNRHKDKRGGGKGGGGGGSGSGMTPVVGAVERNGNVVTKVIKNVQAETLRAFIREAVSNKVSLLCTDQAAGYYDLSRAYPHGSVDHSKGQYVVGAIHTNTIEGFWSIFKRGIVGTYHKVSAKYLALYAAEFAFRYNNRQNDDIFGAAISGC